LLGQILAELADLGDHKLHLVGADIWNGDRLLHGLGQGGFAAAGWPN
jgi:hypothetical protein